jgi:hypothetical protein
MIASWQISSTDRPLKEAVSTEKYAAIGKVEGKMPGRVPWHEQYLSSVRSD